MKEKSLPRSKKLIGLLMFTISFLLLSLISVAQEVTIFTDKDDYWPGEWVVITGSGWTADDSVLITLTHIEPNIPDHSHDPWYVIPDADGYIYDEWFVLEQELGTTFHLTALGFNSGWFAETWFTDGNYLNDITVSVQNPDPVIQGMPVEYALTFESKLNNGYPFTVDLSMLNPPTGVGTITFDPSVLTFSSKGQLLYSTLTIETTASTEESTFTVQAQTRGITGNNGNATGDGELFVIECTPPIAYTVTGTGAYCSEDQGRVVGLNDSETGVEYQLYIDGTTAVGLPVAGTGSAINFGIQAAGTYTVVATRVAGGCTTNMNGSAVVVENTIDPGILAKGATNPGPGCGSLNPNDAGTAASGSTEATGSGTITYQWEESTDESIWTAIAQATEASFNIPEISETTYYRRVATSTLNGVACSASSNVLEYVVNPLPVVSSITPGGTTEVCVNASLQLSNATSNGVWSSSDETIATVDATGLVTGIAEGTVTISYTVTNEFSCEKSANKTVHVYGLPNAPTANNVTVTYDGIEQTASATVPEGIAIDWYTSETGTEATTAPTGTNAGTYTAWAEAQNVSTGCVSAGRTEVTLVIEERPITITADAGQTKVYGEDDPTAFAYTVTTGSLATGDSFDGALTRDPGETVGNYAINKGSLTIVEGATNKESNYDFTYVPADFTVTKAMLTVTADPQTKVYGDANPTLTFQYSGFVNSEDESVLTTEPVASTTVDLLTAVGVHTDAITVAGGVDENYDFTYVPADFTVTKAMLTVTPTLTFQYSGFVNSEDESVLTTEPVASTTVDLLTAVGVHTDAITVAGGVDENYDFTYVPADFTVTKAMLTVTADDASKYCGQVNPTFTVSYDGFVNSEDESVLGGMLVFITDADEYSTGTSYSVTPSGLTSGNYAITFIAGTLTINGVSIDASASSNPVALGSDATISATVVDESMIPVDGVWVTFTLTYYDDSGVEQTLTSVADNTDANGIVTITNVAVPDVKVYKVTAVAGGGCSESVAYLPVYDPSAGFVTGGGWIMSPVGAYLADPGLTGKANFGFVAKYKKGKSDVEGNTEFHFHAAGMKFKSQFHESGSLVISGGKATYRGEGTINGTGSYKFTLVAFDGDWNNGTDPDRFRIKIWGNTGIVYDNGLGADDNSNDATILGDNGRGGGSIVIHEVKSNAKKAAEILVANEVEASSFLAYPNPFTDRLKFEFSSPVATDARLDVYDATGRLVKVVFDQPVEGGVNYNAEFVPNSNMSNLYIYRLTLGAEVINGKVMYTK